MITIEVLQELAGLVDNKKPEVYRYIVCHPSVERVVQSAHDLIDIVAPASSNYFKYSQVEVVTHKVMPLEYCLAVETTEALNKVLEYLDHQTGVEL